MNIVEELCSENEQLKKENEELTSRVCIQGKLIEELHEKYDNLQTAYNDLHDKYDEETQTLSDENHRLEEELEESANMKTEEMIAEMKRIVLSELEEMPSEDMKEFIVKLVSEALTGNDQTCRKKNPWAWICNITFLNSFQVKRFLYIFDENIDRYGFVSVGDVLGILSKSFPNAILADGRRATDRKLKCTFNNYGWDRKVSLRVDGSHVVLDIPKFGGTVE